MRNLWKRFIWTRRATQVLKAFRELCDGNSCRDCPARIMTDDSLPCKCGQYYVVQQMIEKTKEYGGLEGYE